MASISSLFRSHRRGANQATPATPANNTPSVGGSPCKIRPQLPNVVKVFAHASSSGKLLKMSILFSTLIKCVTCIHSTGGMAALPETPTQGKMAAFEYVKCIFFFWLIGTHPVLSLQHGQVYVNTNVSNVVFSLDS